MKSIIYVINIIINSNISVKKNYIQMTTSYLLLPWPILRLQLCLSVGPLGLDNEAGPRIF